MNLKLPKFSGEALSIQPPFHFKNMTACIFPLRAQLDSLQRLCDNYLNIIPAELGRFRASVPYVYLMMLDYGRLAVEATNLGWFSQREVMFCVPVEWYKVESGKWVFHDWATVAPFIYVDDALSMTLGRTVLGWPKSLVTLAPQLTGWMQDPGGTTLDAALTAKVFPKAYAGETMEERVFMKVQSAPLSTLHMPPNMSSALMPWTVMSNVMQAAAGYAMDYMGLLKGMGLVPMHEGSSLQNFGRMAQRAAEIGFPLAPNLSANTLNLKQFRRADKPKEYCYQALTNGPMRFTSFNRGALLGETRIATGDTSGGYSIDLVRWPEFPIVETLGLQVAEQASSEGVAVARLKPVMPFWYDVDMQYEQGHRIAWRSDDGVWRDPEGVPASTSTGNTEERRFNTVLGAGQRVVTGPFQFPSANLRVMPLLASTHKLQSVVDKMLNTPLGEDTPGQQQFRVWAPELASRATRFEAVSYVYLVVKDWGPVSSETNDIGDWADMGSAFYIPVRRYVRGNLVGVGLVPAFAFADGTTQACTLSELYGMPTMEGEFVIAPGAWAPGEGASADARHTLLQVSAEVLPTLGEGQQTRTRVVVDIEHGGGRAFAEAAELSAQAESFCLLVHEEMARKQGHTRAELQEREREKAFGRELALELLTGERDIHLYTMKEFRDGAEPTCACYQALVRVPCAIDSVNHIQELKHLLRVRVHEYPSLPIVEALGLVARDRELVGGSRVHTLEAIRPFQLRVGLTLKNGDRLRSRVGLEWTASDVSEAVQPVSVGASAGPATPDEGAGQGGSAPPLVHAAEGKVEERVSMNFPCHLNRTMEQWRRHQGRDSSAASALSPEALQALERLNPQAVLESVLSREWEDRSSTAERTQARLGLIRDLDEGSSAWGSGILRLDKKLRILREQGWQQDAVARELMAELAPVDMLFQALLAAVDAEEAAFAVGLQGSGSARGGQQPHAYALTQWLAFRDRVSAIIEALLDPEKAKNLRRPGDYILANSLRELRGDHARNCGYSDAQFLSDNPIYRKDCAWGVHRLLKILYAVGDRLIDEAIDAVVAQRRKPDHCVLRSMAGVERERLFPNEFSIGNVWYVGPTPGDVPTTLPTALPRQSQSAKETR